MRRVIVLAVRERGGGGVDRGAVVGHRQRLERLDVVELEAAGGEGAADTVVVDGRSAHAGFPHDDGAAVGEGQVHLEAALVPRFGDRLDAHAGEADDAGVVGDPDRRALAELRVVGTFGEEVVARRVHATGEVDRHARTLTNGARAASEPRGSEGSTRRPYRARMPGLSVIIPARDAAATIAEQLAALAQQTYRGQWELIVVDNGSTDETRHIAERASSMLPLRVVAASRPGINVARNAGVYRATGSFLLFVDADDVVSPGWLAAMASAAESADAVAGALDRTMFTPATHSLPTRERSPGLDQLPAWLGSTAGSNSGVRTSLFRKLGGFDESYRGGGDDLEFFWRVQLAGYEVTSVPDAVVYYRERRTLRAIAKQYRGYGFQEPHLYRDFRRSGMPPSSFRTALRLWVHLVVRAPRYWSDPARRRQWTRLAARRIGRLEGCVRWRTLYL